MDGTVVGYLNIHIIGDGRAFPYVHFITDQVRSKGYGTLGFASGFRETAVGALIQVLSPK
jgi:hypothetical protein